MGGDDEEAAGSIPGRAGVDYPNFDTVPETSFKCDQQEFPGYYADPEAQCQVSHKQHPLPNHVLWTVSKSSSKLRLLSQSWPLVCLDSQVFHICQTGGQMDSFLCPNGTIFNQRYLVCDWYYNVDCSQAEGFWRETNEAVVNAMREADERIAQEKLQQQQQAGGYDSNAQSNDRRGGSNGNGGYQYESSNGQRGQSGNAPSDSFGAPNGNGASSFGAPNGNRAFSSGNRNANGGAPSQTYGAPNGNGNSRNVNGNGNSRNGNGGSTSAISTQFGAPAAGSRNGNRQSSNGNGANGNGPSSNGRAGSAPSSQYGAPATGNGNGMGLCKIQTNIPDITGANGHK